MRLNGIRGDFHQIKRVNLSSQEPLTAAEDEARATAVEGLQLLDFLEQLDGTHLDKDETPGKVRLNNVSTGVGEGRITALWDNTGEVPQARVVISDQGVDDHYNIEGKVFERVTVKPGDSAPPKAQKVSVNSGSSISYLIDGEANMDSGSFLTESIGPRYYNNSNNYGFPLEIEVDKKQQEKVKSLLDQEFGLSQDSLEFLGAYTETYPSTALAFSQTADGERLGGFAVSETAKSLVFRDETNLENYLVRTPELAQPITNLNSTSVAKWKAGERQPRQLTLLNFE